MTKSFDFYFDFISPYSYLAYKKIKLLNNEKELNINYKPILLGGLHNLGGITAPAFNNHKLKNMKSDCELVALKNNIEFKWNSKFPQNSLYLMRGYLVIQNNVKEKFFELCFNAYWKNNEDITDEKNINKILDLVDQDKNDFLRKIENKKIKEMLKKLTSDAFEKDIFGAPTFMIDNKIFWGQDRLDYALEEYYS